MGYTYTYMCICTYVHIPTYITYTLCCEGAPLRPLGVQCTVMCTMLIILYTMPLTSQCALYTSILVDINKLSLYQ